MLNLLPQSEKNLFIQDYRLRFARAVLAALCVLMVIALIGLLPSYVSKKEVTNGLLKERKEADERNTKESLAAADAAVMRNSIVAHYMEERIAKLQKSAIASSLVAKVFEKAGPSISVSGITLSAGALTIQGSAPTRAELISFHQRLKEVPEFKEAVLPIANIAQGVNPDFNIEITLAQ